MDVQNSVSSRYDPNNGDGETFTFDFQLNKARYGPEDARDEQDGVFRSYKRILPNSLAVFGPYCANTTGQSCCQAESLVKYDVEAFVYHGDDIIASSLQELRIFDCADSHPPPVHTAHFPGEFTSSQEKQLKTIYRVGAPRLTISLVEPKAVEVKPEGEVSMTAFAFRFVMRGGSSNPPKKLEIHVNSLLKALTFIGATKSESQPTVKQTKYNPFLAAVPKWGRAYHRKLRVTHWTRGTADGEWVATALVWMPVSEGATPAPTFFTPYLSRRYSISLRLEVTGEGKAVFNLHVPLQIVYPSGDMDVPSYEVATTPAMTPESEEEGFDFGDDDRLPIYVR